MYRKILVLLFSVYFGFSYSQETYRELPIKKKSLDGILNRFEYKSISYTCDYNANPNSIEIWDGSKTYTKDLDFAFDGISSNAYLFNKLNTNILILTFSYEYSEKLLVYRLSDSKLSFLKSITIDIQSDKESFYKLNILSKNNGIELLILQGGSKKKRIDINFESIAQNLKTKTQYK